MIWSKAGLATRGSLVLSGRAASAQGSRNPEAEIQALLDESAASWNRGDLDGHLADNADSISFMTRKGPVVGKTKTADILRRTSSRTASRSSSSASSR